MKLSIIAPLYNEEKNIKPLLREIREVMQKNGFSYEIITINDGSKDGSFRELLSVAEKDEKIKIIDFAFNTGQTAALSAGIEAATGDIIIPIDSDLENDPNDIPLLVKKLEEGYDVVSGWRKDRWKGEYMTRKLPSVVANKIISSVAGLYLHDYGCTLKAYRREIISDVHLYGEMHRFILAYAFWKGARVTEIPVSYRARIYGESKYGFSRTFKVLLDLVVMKFLHKYMNKPMHFFGGVGFLFFTMGVFVGVWAMVLKFVYGVSFISTPLPVLCVFLLLVGVQLIALGVVAEILMRTYYESQGKKPYTVKRTVNL
ncbi:MAG: glycosyltransferase family 2 protein [Candidatus Paceibacterota bacterium]|jgi:glycosyltransferase involved in cell wall biosynthesis